MSREVKKSASDVGLQLARDQFGRQWQEMRRSMSSELGTSPRRHGVSLLLLAGVVGLALGLGAWKVSGRRSKG
jgi:hypothetical protein